MCPGAGDRQHLPPPLSGLPGWSPAVGQDWPGARHPGRGRQKGHETQVLVIFCCQSAFGFADPDLI